MSELFMSASRVMRDELVLQLQKENTFLRELVKKGQGNFYGKNVTIKSYADMDGNVIPERTGILLDIMFSSHCHILHKKENNKHKNTPKTHK